jgi:hypothetical protein
MNITRIIAVGLTVVGCGLVAYGTTPMPNATCDFTEGIQCEFHGHRSCQNAQKERPSDLCYGDCYDCIGPESWPAKICFYDEGETCNYIGVAPCGVKWHGGCDDEGPFGDSKPCDCENFGTASTEHCNFPTCNE